MPLMFMHWREAPQLVGVRLWGRMTYDDCVRLAVEDWRWRTDAGVGHRALWDTRDLLAIDPRGLAHFAAYAASQYTARR